MGGPLVAGCSKVHEGRDHIIDDMKLAGQHLLSRPLTRPLVLCVSVHNCVNTDV